MKRLFFLLLFLPCFCFGQNLVPNSSFEDTVSCPIAQNPPLTAKYWYLMSAATSDVFHTCTPIVPPICQTLSASIPQNCHGYQFPKTGNAYGGLIAYIPIGATGNYKEYLSTRLLTTLVADVEYCVEFYVNLADSCEYAAEEIGAFFDGDSVPQLWFEPLPGTPEVINSNGIIYDKVNWVKISGSFIANGDEDFMHIGGYKHTDSTTIDSMVGGQSGTPYIAYYYVDDVSVVPCGVGIEENNTEATFNIHPNPTTGIFTVQGTATGIQVYDLLGHLVLRTNKKEIDMGSYPAGIYMVRVGEVVRKIVLQ